MSDKIKPEMIKDFLGKIPSNMLPEGFNEGSIVKMVDTFESMSEGNQVTHIKTGKKYTVVSETIIDTTNANDGKRMVMYFSMDSIGKIFVREFDEFWLKFKKGF